MNKEKLRYITTNPFPVVVMLGGVILGVLNQYPNLIMGVINGFFEGCAFYLVAVFLSHLFYTPNTDSKNKEDENNGN